MLKDLKKVGRPTQGLSIMKWVIFIIIYFLLNKCLFNNKYTKVIDKFNKFDKFDYLDYL